MPDNSEIYASEFWDLYNPPISDVTKSLWLDSADNSYAFYRAFVPLYYRILADSSDQNLKNLRELAIHKGWIIGDPHPANFGAVLINSSPLNRSVIYTVNDPDDGFGDSPLYLDFLRFLTGVCIIGNDCNPVNKIQKAYLRGLNGEGLGKEPREVRKCLRRLWKREKCFKKRDYKKLYEGKKRRLNYPIAELSSRQLTILKAVLKSVWKDLDLRVDQGFEYIRKKGGSGGLARKVLLLKFSKRKQPVRISKSKWLVVELKGMRQPSIQYLSNLSAEQVKEAEKQTMRRQCRNKLSILYGIVKDRESTCSNGDSSIRDQDGQYWSVRPRWVENPVVDPNDVENKKQRKKIYLYQANILGDLHRANAINASAYYDEVKRFKAKEWKKAAEYMANKLKNQWLNKEKISIRS